MGDKRQNAYLVAKLNAGVELYSLLRKLLVPLGRIGLCTVC